MLPTALGQKRIKDRLSLHRGLGFRVFPKSVSGALGDRSLSKSHGALIYQQLEVLKRDAERYWPIYGPLGIDWHSGKGRLHEAVESKRLDTVRTVLSQFKLEHRARAIEWRSNQANTCRELAAELKHQSAGDEHACSQLSDIIKHFDEVTLAGGSAIGPRVPAINEFWLCCH